MQGMKKLKARIFKIESLNTHNGPGYRTVVYFKGCPLKCDWCHNPEGISREPEIWILNNTCIGCKSCVEACPVDALTMTENGIKVDRNLCNGCFECAEICPSKSIEKLGEDINVDRLFRRIMEDKPFMDASGGGITVTGGEPGIAPEFVSQLFEKCKKTDIHTAFDTSGFISKKALEMIIPLTDLVFFDLKIMDEKRSKEMTGHGNSKIFETLNWIKSYKLLIGGPELQFRTPIIPGATDSMANLNAIAHIIQTNYKGLFSEWELNLFNDICEDKYNKMDRSWHFKDTKFDLEDYQKIEEFVSNN